MPTVNYIEILAVQEPFSIGTDANSRVMYSVNFNAIAKAPVVLLEESVIKILTDAGLATEGADTFMGPTSEVPSGDGPYSTVINTGGVSPLEVHDGNKYSRLSFQIITVAASLIAARERICAMWLVLDGKRNINVTV